MHHFFASLMTVAGLFFVNSRAMDIESRQSTAPWHITDEYIGCGNGFCSYQFHITGDDTGDLPYFEADCTQQVGIGDHRFRQCSLVGGGSQNGLTIDGVYAFVALYPRNRLQSRLVVQLQFENPFMGSREYWQAEQDGQYQFFSQGPGDYDVVPMQAAAVA